MCSSDLKRLVNGYAGIEPTPYVDLRNKAQRFPSEDSIAALRARGVRFVILHRGGFGPNKWARVSHWAGVRCDASPIAVGMARRAVRAAPSGRAGRESLGRIRALPFDVQSSDS